MKPAAFNAPVEPIIAIGSDGRFTRFLKRIKGSWGAYRLLMKEGSDGSTICACGAPKDAPERQCGSCYSDMIAW